MGKKVLTYSVFYVIMKIRIDISFVCDRNRKKDGLFRYPILFFVLRKLFCQDVQLQFAAQFIKP